MRPVHRSAARLVEVSGPKRNPVRVVTAKADGVAEIASSGSSYAMPTGTSDPVGDRVGYEGWGVTRYEIERSLILDRTFTVRPTRVVPGIWAPARMHVEIVLE